jgi:hypothetical protein
VAGEMILHAGRHRSGGGIAGLHQTNSIPEQNRSAWR